MLENNYKFTGKERDTETGLDYFGARYYSNGLGRFITPDWAAKAADVPYADFADPQSLNLYTYVRNVPTSEADPDGHCPTCVLEEVEEFAETTAPAPILQFAKKFGPAAVAGVALGVEAKSFIDAHAIRVKAKADMEMVKALAPQDQKAAKEAYARVQAEVKKQQDQQQNQGQTEEEKKEEEPEPQTSTSGGQQGSSGRGTAGGGRDRSQQGTTDQVDDIMKNQQIKRKRGQGEAIRDTSKSQQNERHELKKIKSSEDIQDH